MLQPGWGIKRRTISLAGFSSVTNRVMRSTFFATNLAQLSKGGRSFRELIAQEINAITVLLIESKLLFGPQSLRWIG